MNSDNEKIIFGGLCLPENNLLNDVWNFNYSNLAFNSTLPEIPGAVCSLRKTKVLNFLKVDKRKHNSKDKLG